MTRKAVSRFLQQHHITRHMMKVYFSCYVILVPGGLVVTMIFPYLPFIVKFLLPDVPEQNIGRYSGFLASSMYFGGFCSSYFWGWLADRHSKKTILIYSGVCMAFSSLLFGFSVNFYVAVMFKFFTGLANGIVVTVKAIISEHSDDVNQGFGMSLVIALWDASIVFGPAISGVLADPIGQYNLPSNSFLAKFPYCLPNMFIALFCVLGVITVGCLLPDKPDAERREQEMAGEDFTNVNNSAMKSNDVKLDSETGGLLENTTMADNIVNCEQILSVNQLSYRKLLEKENLEDEEVDTIVMDDLTVDENVESMKQNVFKSQIKVKWLSFKQVIHGCQILLSLIRNKVTLGAVFLHGMYAFGVIEFEESFSLWSATSSSLGGLGFSPHDIGTILGIAGLLLVPVSLAVFIPLEKRLGALLTFHIHIALVIVLLPVFPSLTYISPNQTALLWIMLNIISVVIRVAINNCFVCESLFLNNSVTADKLGAANGLANSVTNIFQIFSPVFFGTVYSLSISGKNQQIGFPFDFHLIFILLSLVFLLTMTLVAFFPKKLDKQIR